MEEGRRAGADRCLSCGNTMSAGAPGETCTGCLLRIGLAERDGEVEIDGFEVIEKLGEGGMGEVYLAEQMKPVTRLVAIKVIKLGMDSRALVQRFGSERQALALMDHPSIAAVYDAGTTAAGRPYFAMEWVDGVPIDEFCNGEDVGLRERLELFERVALAVQHAHAKGVIHCDLKPSNVLVARHGEGGMPKVIDFGVAKAVDPEAKLGQTRFTSGGQAQVVGTPSYMAPEQAEGSTQDVDARADVYSLGATLYELLSGSPPFDERQLTSGGVVEMLRVLKEENPHRPSLRAADAGRKLPVDLDWIVMRAMEKERDRRYDSPGQLASDIRRFLDHEPVEARPPSAGYQLSKFARRHRFVIAAGALVALALMIGAVVSTFQAIRAREAEKEAIASRERGEVLVELMLQELYGTLKDLGRLDMLEEVADAALGYYDSLPPDDSETGLIGRSSAMSKISEIKAAQGDHEQALKIALRALAVLDVRANAPGAAPPLRYELALRNAQVGLLTREQQGAAASMSYLEEAIAKGRELVAQDDENRTDYESFLAGFYNIAGSSHLMLGDFEGALASLEESKRLREGLLARFPDEVVRQSDVAEICGDLARIFAEQKRFEEGAPLIARAVAIREGIPAKRPGELFWRSRLASTYFDHGRFLRRSNELGSAAEAIGRALEIWRALIAEDPENLTWQASLAACVQEFVVIGMEADRSADLVQEATEAVGLWSFLVERGASHRKRKELVRSQMNLGLILEAAGDREGAAASYERAVETARTLLSEEIRAEGTRRSVESFKALVERKLNNLGG